MRTPQGDALSYAGLQEQAVRFTTALKSFGVMPGDRVAAQVDKSAAAVILYVACVRMGAIFVPINVSNTPREVEFFLRDSQPCVVIVRPSDRQVLEPLARAAGVRCVVTLGADGDGSLSERVGQCAVGDGYSPPPDSQSVAAIIYTSGTTGRAKGAMLTRRNLASNAAALAVAWRFSENDVLLHTLPLFHVHGLFAAINTVLASASSLVLMPKFNAADVLEWLPRVSVYMGVPTHYTRCLQETGLNREVTADMRLFVSGSAPLLPDTQKQFRQRTGHMILERYGMTETLMNTSNPYEGPRLAGSVGRALPGISLRVARAVAGDADGTVGMLEVQGPNVFAGYWRDPDKTRSEFTTDGWFKTGDLGRIDDAGYVFIVGRAKDLVISGGFNVYPKEVELELDALDSVHESAVFGVAHPDFGEGVTAAVVIRPGTSANEKEMLSAIKTRLAGYKIPKRIIIVTELPRNAMGKVQKNVLRARYSGLYDDA